MRLRTSGSKPDPDYGHHRLELVMLDQPANRNVLDDLEPDNLHAPMASRVDARTMLNPPTPRKSRAFGSSTSTTGSTTALTLETQPPSRSPPTPLNQRRQQHHVSARRASAIARPLPALWSEIQIGVGEQNPLCDRASHAQADCMGLPSQPAGNSRLRITPAHGANHPQSAQRPPPSAPLWSRSIDRRPRQSAIEFLFAPATNRACSQSILFIACGTTTVRCGPVPLRRGSVVKSSSFRSGTLRMPKRRGSPYRARPPPDTMSAPQ